VILLQRTEQRFRPLRLAGVAAQRAEQQRQRCTDRRLRLPRIQAELLRHLPDGSALQLRGKVLCERSGHGVVLESEATLR
jgi:hypothetical protein